MLRFHFAARSDVGGQRELNEDSGLASERLLVVADGLGGHAAGELASSTAISVVNTNQLDGLSADQVAKKLVGIIKELSRKLLEQSSSHTERSGLGTTLSLAYLAKAQEVVVFHIGDSRIYRNHEDSFEQLTKDHTYVQQLIESGKISEQQAQVHPQRSLLTQAIDGVTPAIGDFTTFKATTGDKFLVCTDGLSAVLTNDEIKKVLSELEPAAAVARLVDLALDRGAPDNVTVIVAEVIDSENEKSSAPIVVGAAAMKDNRDSLASLNFPQDQMPTLESSKQAVKSYDVFPGVQTPVDTFYRTRVRLIVITALITFGFALLGIYAALLSTQLFVGVEGDKVAIFRGIPQSLAFIELNRPLVVSDLEISKLASFEQQQVSSGISVADETSGQLLIKQLRTRLDLAK